MAIPVCPEHPTDRALRSEKHDAYYCVKCDAWLERRCPDDACEHCAKRPAHPSQITED